MLDNGGPAFPNQLQLHPYSGERILDESHGMSLRDWFAGQALIAIFSGAERNDGWDEKTAKVNAGFAYELADAMIVERQKCQ